MDTTDSGPESFEEMMGWARKLLSSALAFISMKGADEAAVLKRIFSMKLLVTTSYSGIGVPELSLHFLQDALRAHRGGGELSFCIHSSTEIDRFCRRMLEAHHTQTGSEHLFGDLLERVTKQDVEALQELQGKYKALFNAAVRRQSETLSPTQRKTLVSKYGRAFVAASLEYLSNNASLSRACECHCYKHNRCCRIWPENSQNTMHLEVAGVTCTPWSMSGKQLGWLDPNSVPCIVWMFSMQV